MQFREAIQRSNSEMQFREAIQMQFRDAIQRSFTHEFTYMYNGKFKRLVQTYTIQFPIIQ